MFRACALALWAGASLVRAAQPAPEAPISPTGIYVQVRDKVFAHLRQAANYTCIETTERSQSYTQDRSFSNACPAPGKRSIVHPFSSDRLRLDVAVSSNSEIFSWHGGPQFSTEGVDSVVKSGTTSSGSFVGYLQNIFGVPGIKIQYTGRLSAAGRSLVHFAFQVPRESSKFQVGPRKTTLPFDGTFVVDGSTYELVDLRLNSDNTPPETRMCSTAMSIAYQLIDVSGTPSLIPAIYSMELTLRGGYVSKTRTQFSDCHAFLGESTVHYDDQPNTQSEVIQSPNDPLLPEGIRIRAALKTRISSRESYTGDPIEASLSKAFTVKGSNLAFAKGALLTGFISQLEYLYEPVPHYFVAIRLNRITDGKHSYRLETRMEPGSDTRLAIGELALLNSRRPGPQQLASEQIVMLGKQFETPPEMQVTWMTLRKGGE